MATLTVPTIMYINLTIRDLTTFTLAIITGIRIVTMSLYKLYNIHAMLCKNVLITDLLFQGMLTKHKPVINVLQLTEMIKSAKTWMTTIHGTNWMRK